MPSISFKRFRDWKKESKYIFFSYVIIVIYLSPMFILGEHSHIRVHDNLDSNIAWYKVLHHSGLLFGGINSVVPQIIGGLPRNAYGTEFSGIQWLHNLLPSMEAYSISQAITRVFAFLGMYLLLRRHFLKGQEYLLITAGVSLCFALTPFWPSGMLSTLGHPLALWAFLNIRSGRSSYKDWLTLVLLPFYSSFVLGFFFFLAAMGILWVRDVLVKKKWNFRFFGSIALMTAVYLLIEYRLVYSLVFPTAPTSRNEFVSSKLSFGRTIWLFIKNYFLGHTHVMTLHTLVIVPLSFIVFWMIYKKKAWREHQTFVRLFALNILLSLWYAFWFYKGWEPLKDRYQLLNTFNFARFHFLRPLVIYMMFAVGAAILWNRNGRWKIFVKVCLLVQLLVLFGANPEIYYRAAGYPSFQQFYAEKQFKEIKEYIGMPQKDYRVASIGLHPAIAQYNGFYTVDTYNNFYDLSYKHQFRKIIAPELQKSHVLRTYFDEWGGRCYIFSSELGKYYLFQKDSKKKIRHLQLDTEAFKKLGGRYFLSSVPILNAEDIHLDLLRTFNDKNSAWKIYLYEVQ
ncbi:DUF6044 family protein [Peribacillus kribbensis]|uniref:DUF6044 family protein n=1 Tax=Peribacillus kribbensis TaxID=356658 RepID=UPI0003F7D97A|nr:DUF6044 family protein [Peribacillus kribbensis]